MHEAPKAPCVPVNAPTGPLGASHPLSSHAAPVSQIWAGKCCPVEPGSPAVERLLRKQVE